MNSETVRHWGVKPLLAAALMAGTAAILQSCKDDILTGQPGWLGNSIYERLQEEGGYNYTLKLIDDLGYHDVISKTGSKTLFVADDAAYENWFTTNAWGVKNYDGLSTAQKKLLLNGSMVNNAYLIELLSNVSGNPPETGKCMRRETASSYLDSVYVIKPEDMPNTTYWSKYKNADRSLVLLKDNTSQPMIHLLPAYMKLNKITDNDVKILTNGEAQSAAEAYINGKKVIERDITCKNGYLHKVEGVVEPITNMADLIRQKAETKTWSTLLDRFSAPYYDDAATKEYNRIYDKNDSVYVLRYFSDWAKGGKLTGDPDGKAVKATLAFDPGWNQYMYSNTMGYDLHYDAAAMIVPNEEVLAKWWDASALKRHYGVWDSVPDLVLSKLLRNNMIDNFSEKVPSKFDNILNDAKIKMGVTPDNIQKCYMACNGVVYVVDKVFAPSAYSSVSFPALIDQDNFSVIYEAIDELEFDPYLGSMDSKYGLLLPTNKALEHYIDPINYGETDKSFIKFMYDPEEESGIKIKAERYKLTYNSDGTPNFDESTKLLSKVSEDVIKNRLEDLLNQCIIVLDADASDVANKVTSIDGQHTYYKTKGGSIIKAVQSGDGIAFQGGLQMEHGMTIEVPQSDIMTQENGWAYQTSSMPFGSSQTVYSLLKEKDQYKKFLSLLEGSDPDSTSSSLLVNSLSKDKYTCTNADGGNLNMRIFDNYNYTVYVPGNDAIQKLIDDGYLPTWDDFDTYRELKENASVGSEDYNRYNYACYIIKKRITDFVRYHVQDNSVIIGGQAVSNTAYESMLRNPVTNRYYSLTVNSDNSGLSVTDVSGNTRHVVKTNGLYNQICREYWLSGNRKQKQYTRTIYQASDAVVHLIDAPLYYGKLTKWKTEIDNWKDETNK